MYIRHRAEPHVDFNISPAALTPTENCLYHGIQINRGDVFRPTSIVEDFQSMEENLDVRNECVECSCEVRLQY